MTLPSRVKRARYHMCEVYEFDPSNEPWRVDVDVLRWGRLGVLPKSDKAPPGKNLWKMDPGRDTTSLVYHFSRGYPSPPQYIAECECIARRNARELAENLGPSDFANGWPSDRCTIYLPKPNHLAEDAIHIDELPERGKALRLPAGEA